MELAIFNGSPRSKKSNSKILMEQFLKGYAKINPAAVSIRYLAILTDMEGHVKAFDDAQTAIIILPLYTDCMPGIVKDFMEHIAKLKLLKPKRVGFIVQSGFPEAMQSTFVEAYLKKFTNRLGCQYLGTIIKGGVEGIQVLPECMNRKLFSNFTLLGEHFAKTGEFSSEIAQKLLKPYRLSKFKAIVFKLLSKTQVTNFYWNSNLKKNNAFEARFARPYWEDIKPI